MSARCVVVAGLLVACARDAVPPSAPSSNGSAAATASKQAAPAPSVGDADVPPKAKETEASAPASMIGTPPSPGGSVGFGTGAAGESSGAFAGTTSIARDTDKHVESPAQLPLSHGKLGLTAEQVRNVVLQHAGVVRACHATSPGKGRDLRVTVKWNIDPDGLVSDAAVVASSEDPRFDACVISQLRKWLFPSSDAQTRVAGYPFNLRAQADSR